jgi:hypothetical protein
MREDSVVAVVLDCIQIGSVQETKADTEDCDYARMLQCRTLWTVFDPEERLCQTRLEVTLDTRCCCRPQLNSVSGDGKDADVADPN